MKKRSIDKETNIKVCGSVNPDFVVLMYKLLWTYKSKIFICIQTNTLRVSLRHLLQQILYVYQRFNVTKVNVKKLRHYPNRPILR